MALIHNPFLHDLLAIHQRLQDGTSYPFFDPACQFYEALRAAQVEGIPLATVFDTYGLTEYQYRKALEAFRVGGMAHLIGLSVATLTEALDLDVERRIFVLKQARPWIPATKMVILLQGFGIEIELSSIRHLYASHGWALGTKSYTDVDFGALNLKVVSLVALRQHRIDHADFFNDQDRLQTLLEVFRTLGSRGICNRYPGSRVTLRKHEQAFRMLGLLGLVDQARPPFRNSKVGFKEEGWLVLSRIQQPDNSDAHYQKILATKQINVDVTCVTKIFSRWQVAAFQSQFKGDLNRLLDNPDEEAHFPLPQAVPDAPALRLDLGFVNFCKSLTDQAVPLANPGLFLFLLLLHRLRLFEAATQILKLDPDQGYSWFSLLLLNLGRIFSGLSSVSKACRTHEFSLPLSAGLVQMPCSDSLLNGLATITEPKLLQLRRSLTQSAYDHGLVRGRSVALDFHMRDFTGDDVTLKNIGKGPSPKRHICFPGFRPHIAWDVATGAPLSLEFRNGKARATTTFKRFILDLLPQALGPHDIDHVYLDSEYTGQKAWQFIVDEQAGLGANLTLCIKQNLAIKKHVKAFVGANQFQWLFFDQKHTFSSHTFSIPIHETDKVLHCVLKRHEPSGKLRCFGSTLPGLDARGILSEYERRWVIENGIKDLVGNYFFDNIPGIDPHRINIHYFVVTLARLLYQIFCHLYPASSNPDESQKGIGTIRHEFLAGANATMTREGSQLVLTWQDAFPQTQHEQLTALFDALNEIADEPIPFLGGLKLKFQLNEPREPEIRNRMQRVGLDFG